MNIMVLEDDADAVSLVNYLESMGHKVWHAASLLDTAYFFEEDPKLERFDALLFDASVPSEDLSCLQHPVKLYGKRYGMAGVEFVLDLFDDLQTVNKKIAFVTAYKASIKKEIPFDKYETRIIDSIPIIDKSADDFVRKISEFLNGK